MKYILLVLMSALVVSGCTERNEAKSKSLQSAVVTKIDVSPPRPQVEITDKAQFMKLMSFFPKLRSEKEIDLAGGWEGKYEVVFSFSDGTQIKVTTSYDDKVWSSGKGDKSLTPGLSAFLDPMFKK